MNRLIRTSFRKAPARAATQFHRNEDGSLTIFGLFLFIIMMIAGGIALDVMRSEVERTELQYAIDRAVLAAANLEQSRDPKTVVDDYIRAAGLDSDNIQVTPTITGQDRRVSITARTQTKSLFLDILGIDELVQPVSSEAREVRTELELSLVVDISGSMGGSKINTLRTAASDFVAQLLEDRESLTTISLVPYNDRVNAGSLLNGLYDFTQEHQFSNCVVFPDSAFRRLDHPSNEQMQRMGHFDWQTENNDGNDAGLVDGPNCVTDNYGAILPWSNDVDELQSRIVELNAGNWTAMDLGVKWGTLLLDPSSADELLELTVSPDADLSERVDPVFADRPAPYSATDTRKVLVVMTDGDNTVQWDVKPQNRTGMSGVWVHRVCAISSCSGNTAPISMTLQNANLSVNPFGATGASCGSVNSEGRIVGAASGNTPFGTFVSQFQRNRNLATVQACLGRFDDTEGGRYSVRYSVHVPERSGSNKYWIDRNNNYASTPDGGNAAIQLTWQQLLGSIPRQYIRNTILSGMTSNTTRNRYWNSYEQTHDQARADANLSNICRKAREAGIVIYTIAFQAPRAGQAAMRDCAGAGNEARYFDVVGLNLQQAFDDVLASVSRLRLTQ